MCTRLYRFQLLATSRARVPSAGFYPTFPGAERTLGHVLSKRSRTSTQFQSRWKQTAYPAEAAFTARGSGIRWRWTPE